MASPEPESNEPKKKKTIFNKVIQDEEFNKKINWLWERRFLLFAGALMFLGIVFSFYYIHIGGFLVGLAVGLAFFDEIRIYVAELRELYLTHSLFKTLMLIGIAIYFLIAVPLFIFGAAIGFSVKYLIHWLEKKR